MPPPDDTTRLRHILDAAQKVLQFTQGKERLALDTDELSTPLLLNTASLSSIYLGGSTTWRSRRLT